jgi:hypothetical protein
VVGGALPPTWPTGNSRNKLEVCLMRLGTPPLSSRLHGSGPRLARDVTKLSKVGVVRLNPEVSARPFRLQGHFGSERE